MPRRPTRADVRPERGRHPSGPRTLRCLFVVSGLVPIACSGEQAVERSTTTTTVAPSTTVRPDDGVFLVGLVVPSSGIGADIGGAVTAGVRLAVDEINAAGGAAGQKILLVPRDEGDTAASAAIAVNELIELGVDAMIGPTSSLSTLATLATAVDAGVLTCSPTASAMALDEFPDRNLFLRTIPSDSLQAVGLAEVVDEVGGARTALVYLNDPYGRPFGEAVESALESQGISLAATALVTPDETSIESAVAAIADARADAVVVVADAALGASLINDIDATDTARPVFVVNDALRRPEFAGQLLDTDLAARVLGISPLARADNQAFEAGLIRVSPASNQVFAHNGYDCMNVIALAAAAADSVIAADVAGAIFGVSNRGTSCRSFPECIDLLAADRNIDYDGPSGEMSVGPNGDLGTAVFEQFGFVDGRDVTERTFVVGSD